MAAHEGGIMAIDQAFGDGWALYQGDSIDVARGLPDASVDFSLHSPPFSNLYIYSDSANDMGNCQTDDEFFGQYSFLIRELHRLTVPGRLASVHCKDLPAYMNRDGAAGLRDFPGAIIRAFEAEGWVYHSRVTIWKDPVTEMERTKNMGLLYKHFRTMGEVCRQGMADYIVTFRKWTERKVNFSPKPVIHERTEWPLEIWQRYASPVWMDIDQMDVLNYRLAKGDGDEKHICPLQLGVIRRCIELWTNLGEVVFSPFAGVGSEGVGAMELKRHFVGVELKDTYFRAATRFLAEAERKAALPDLFALAGVEVAS